MWNTPFDGVWKMRLDSCLRQIGVAMRTDNGILANYAAQDTWSGAHDGWPSESITRMEGQIIYAIVRTMRPLNVLEYGVCGGCSSTHILQALADNEKGKLTSFDVNDVTLPGPQDYLRNRWEFIRANGITHKYGDYHCDICFEDTSHTHHSTTNLVEKALELGAKCIIVHDIANATSGAEIRRALDEVLGKENYLVILTEDSNLGLAIWVRKS